MQMCPGQARCCLLNGNGVGVGASGAMDIREGASCPSSPRQVLRFRLVLWAGRQVKKMDEVGQKEGISKGVRTTNLCWEAFSPVEKGSELG